MIHYQRKVLSNGLRVLVQEDFLTPMVAVNVLYNVGSKDEDECKTGFAHLFEHLMFSGSANAKDFDGPIQSAGGENNAFTNSDITNFYDVVPANNVETVLWLESDRMAYLNVTDRPFEVQRKVVVEEFKETCLNQAYGDMWHHMSDLSYKVHPYRWPTIGKIPEHISEATLQDVQTFYKRHYGPNNAILVFSGAIAAKEAFKLAEKWFGDIEPIDLSPRSKVIEPAQDQARQKVIFASVPNPAIYQAYHMVDRLHPDYYVTDLLSDVLANGRSSRFYLRLHKEKQYFSTIDAYISGTIDPGLFIIEGKPMEDISIEMAREAILTELFEVKQQPVTKTELEKLKNKTISSLLYSEVSILNKAISLAYFELLGEADLINREAEAYESVTVDDIQRVANQIFTEENCSELIYHPN